MSKLKTKQSPKKRINKWPGHKPGILATQKAEARDLEFKDSLGSFVRPYLIGKGGWKAAQEAEHPQVWLRSKHSLVWRRLSRYP